MSDHCLHLAKVPPSPHSELFGDNLPTHQKELKEKADLAASLGKPPEKPSSSYRNRCPNHRNTPCSRPPTATQSSSKTNWLPRYISWLSEPHAYAVGAFTVSWQYLTFYAFPPFSLLPRVLAKILQDKATGLLIVPKWTTQSWFPLVLTLLIQHPRVIAPCRDLYLLQQPQVVHPLHKKLPLLAVLLSGMPSRVSAYQNQRQPSPRNPEVLALWCSMTPFSEDGRGFVLEGKSIPCLPLSSMSLPI